MAGRPAHFKQRQRDRRERGPTDRADLAVIEADQRNIAPDLYAVLVAPVDHAGRDQIVLRKDGLCARAYQLAAQLIPGIAIPVARAHQ